MTLQLHISPLGGQDRGHGSVSSTIFAFLDETQRMRDNLSCHAPWICHLRLYALSTRDAQHGIAEKGAIVRRSQPP